MPAGRPSKIATKVSFTDPVSGKKEAKKIAITEAICRYIELGVYPTNAAKAMGISPATYGNWISRGRDYLGAWENGRKLTKTQLAYVEFLNESTRAEAAGLIWHEVNVRLAGSDRERDGRVSLEFLARRQPAQYSKRVEIDLDPGDREPAPLDAPLVSEAREAFLAAHVPEGIDPASVLPEIDE